MLSLYMLQKTNILRYS